MRVLYCHGHRLKKDKNKYYSNGSFSSEVFERYLSVFEEVVFLSRQERLKKSSENLTLVNTDRLYFEKVDNLRNLKNRRKAKKKIEREVIKADAVISRLPSSIGQMAIKYAKKYNKPYMIEVVGCPWDALYNHGSLVGKILAPKSYLSMKKMISESDRTSYITRSFLQNRYPTKGKSYIAPNVFINKVDENILDAKISKIRNKNKDEVYRFGLIGSLDVGYKGHSEVLKAFNIIKKENPQVKFKVEFLGEGKGEKLKKELEKFGLKKDIIFKGSLPSGDEVFKWMDTLDITLQPSKAEAQGRSIIEAMSRGNPVIASKVGGIVELIDEKWLIEAGDYKDLKDKIMTMIKNKDLMEKQAKKNFNEAMNYTEEKVNSSRYTILTEFKNDISRGNKQIF